MKPSSPRRRSATASTSGEADTTRATTARAPSGSWFSSVVGIIGVAVFTRAKSRTQLRMRLSLICAEPRTQAPSSPPFVRDQRRRAGSERLPTIPPPMHSERRRPARCLPMLDINLLRKDLAHVVQRLERRKAPQPFLDVERFSALENERKAIQTRTEELQARRNALSKEIGQRKAKGLDTAETMAEVANVGDALKISAERLEVIQAELSA